MKDELFSLQREITDLQHQVEGAMNHVLPRSLITDDEFIQNIVSETESLQLLHSIEDKDLEKKELRRKQQRESKRRSRSSLSPDSKMAYNRDQRNRMSNYRANMTPEQRDEVKAKDRLRKSRDRRL